MKDNLLGCLCALILGVLGVVTWYVEMFTDSKVAVLWRRMNGRGRIGKNYAAISSPAFTCLCFIYLLLVLIEKSVPTWLTFGLACLMLLAHLAEASAPDGVGEGHAYIPAGTELSLRLEREVSSKDVSEGEFVPVVVLGDLRLNGGGGIDGARPRAGHPGRGRERVTAGTRMCLWSRICSHETPFTF